MVKTYTVHAERDLDGGWIGEVEQLPGCYSEAADPESLEYNMREAILVYLETLGGADVDGRIEMTMRSVA